MKNIFKKNQIIITALCIMIAIAGYLSFTNNDKPDDPNAVETTNPDLEDLDDFTALDGLEMVTDTTGGTTDGTTDDTTDGTTDGTTDDTTVDDTTVDDTEEDLADDAGKAIEEDATTEEDAADELGDISDEDILSVTDNGELELEEGVPGEAVLANAAVDSGYFISSRLDREQRRAKSKADLKEIIDSPDISKEDKQAAIQKMIELTSNSEKESAIEILLGAKGFDGSIVYIVDDMVNVVVNAKTLTDQQLAIVESVVKDNTGFAVENIHINPAVVEE